MADLKTDIALDIYRPGIYIDIDHSLSRTGLPVFTNRAVMIGQLGTNAEAVAGQMVPVITEANAKALFGVDSMLTAMVRYYRAINPYQELLVVPLADLEAGQKATGTITVAGAATRGATQTLYIAGKRYHIGVDAAEDAASVAGRVATMINNDPAAYVTASSDGAEVTLTAKWKGETGNDISQLTRFHADDYGTPGLTFTITAMAGGSGNPDVTAAIDALDDLTQYQGIVTPYTDTANMDLIRAEMDARFGPLQQRDGRVITAMRAGVATMSTYAKGRNSQHQAVMDTGEASASPPWEWAAAFAGCVMYHGAMDPARPFQTLEMAGLRPAPPGQYRIAAELETLLRNGVSTHLVGDDGKVRIERAVTTYSENATGAEDEAYKSLNTVMTMSYYRRSIINRFRTRYPRHKLATNGHPAAGFGGNIVTPNTAVSEFITHYKLMIDAGLMDDFDGYKADIIGQKNSQVRGRVDVFDRPRPIDQFHQLAVRAAFKLV